MLQTSNKLSQSGLLLAGLLLLLSLSSLRALEGSTVPFDEDYDPQTHVGTLLLPGPDREPKIVRQRTGLQVVDMVELRTGNQSATLVLWGGYPAGRWSYPELWLHEGQDAVRQVWPMNPDLDWIDAEIETQEVDGDLLAVVTRRLTDTRLDAPPVRTRERLQVTSTGLKLVEKKFSKWKTTEQLQTVLADLLATGQLHRVPTVLRAHEARRGALSESASQRLTIMLHNYLTKAKASPSRKDLQ
jgi:hypothetical protein